MAKTMLSRWLVVAVLGVAGLSLAACGDDDDDDGAATEEETTTTAGDTGGGGGDAIEISGFTFPDEVTAAPGDTVVFTNADDAPHTVTADDGEFDSGDIAAGGEGEITAPDEPGEYTFHCEIHQSMTSTLVVS